MVVVMVMVMVMMMVKTMVVLIYGSEVALDGRLSLCVKSIVFQFKLCI